jgi:3-hydroxybutyrate dehydrogenase
MFQEAELSNLKGRHALVTGGGSGIGAACAAALSQAGADVTVLGRNESALRAQVEAGHALRYLSADLTDAAAVVEAFAALDRPVDLLINNAGAAASGAFVQSADDDFRSMMEINLLSAVRTSRLALPGMIERGFGRIVNVGSVAALKGYAYVAAYVASKHALLGLTRALAVEVARTGVTVNAVCPGYVDTDLVTRSVETIVARTGRTPDQAIGAIAAHNPQGRLITPQEVAAAVLFLCADAAGGVNGAALPVSGGEI